jgi:hypothetical protein
VKGAFVLGNDAELYGDVERTLVSNGASAADDRTVQLRDRSGTLFTVFGDVAAFENDLRDPPIGVRGDDHDLDQHNATSCWVECRSEEVFVYWVRLIAADRSAPIWVLDGDGILWAAESLNVDELTL